MTDTECPNAIQVAANAFYAAIGGENLMNTPSGALADANFPQMVDYVNRLTAAVDAAGANADVGSLATEVFAKMFPEGNYQQLSNGAIADVNFSMLTEFTNQLNMGQMLAELCRTR